MVYRFVMRGKRRNEYVTFFLEKGAIRQGEGHYRAEEWLVWIGEEQKARLGSLEIPEVEVVLDLFGTESGELVEQFRRVFLTAGG